MKLRNIAGLVSVFATTACIHAQVRTSPLGTPSDAPRRVELATPQVVVPLQKEGAFYFTPVRINGRQFRFTVETGANFVAISGTAARALGVAIDSVEFPTIGGAPQRAPVVRLDSVAIGGVTFHGLTARVNPAWDAQSFDGIISVPYFQNLLVSLELSKSRITFAKGALPPPNGRDIVPLVRLDRAGRIDIEMNLGAQSVPVVVDTRSFVPLVISDSLISTIPTEAPPRDMGVAAGPSQGTFTLRGARYSGSARIGGATINRAPIAFRNRAGGVIGVPLLELIDLTFDLANSRVRVASANGAAVDVGAQSWETDAASGATPAGGQRRAAEPPPVSSGQRTMGFNLAGYPGTPDLRVVNVVRGSDAERAGLKNDDVLIEFDGTPAASMNPTVFRAAIARETATKVIVKRGNEQLTFTIKPYIMP